MSNYLIQEKQKKSSKSFSKLFCEKNYNGFAMFYLKFFVMIRSIVVSTNCQFRSSVISIEFRFDQLLFDQLRFDQVLFHQLSGPDSQKP